MPKIDISSIQYVPPSIEDQKDEVPEQQNGVTLEDMVKDSKTIKKAYKTAENDTERKDKLQLKKDRQNMVCLLAMYINNFSNHLGEYKKSDLKRMTLEELYELQKEFDEIIQSKKGLKKNQTMIISGICLLESVTTHFTPFQCHGLSDSLLRDEDTLEEIKHIALRHLSPVSMTPEISLGLKIVMNMMALHNANSSKLALNEKKLQDLNNSYSDL